MASSSILHHSSNGAITVSQFLDSLRRTWLNSHRASIDRDARLIPRKLGLAVSGGADSMALAHLCRQWEKTYSNSNERGAVSVTAFVVDHKAREESSREANVVARWLTEMGIKTQILELRWPTGNLAPSNMTAFETHARHLRFQALGEACRAHQIEALLMGHHQDDNIETTLWRLSTGARGAGLAGIPPVARIPECHGLYGVSESGSTTIIHPEKLLQSRLPWEKTSYEDSGTSIPISTGGIYICRPLLGFPKKSLLATCHENNVPFVSDPTNFDPTLTPRNAIRSLLSAKRVPQALQGPSILSLIQKSNQLIQDSIRLSDQLLKECKILKLMLTTGTIKIQFPSSSTNIRTSSHHYHQIQSLTLRRITELISPFPENHFPLRNFQNFTHHVFPHSSTTPEPPKHTSFTLGGTMFQPQPSPSHSAPSKKTNNSNNNDNYDIHTITNDNVDEDNNDNIWLLSRQPFMRHRLPVSTLEAPIPDIILSSLPSIYSTSPTTPASASAPIYTPWTLWDNRFWLRFALVPSQKMEKKKKNNDDGGDASGAVGDHDDPLSDPFQRKGHKEESSSSAVPIKTSYLNSKGEKLSVLPLVVRPLQQSDLRIIRQKQKQIRQSGGGSRGLHDPSSAVVSFLDRLDRNAPGQSRFTLPLLCIAETFTDLGQDLPLGLPTLDIWLPTILGSTLQESFPTPIPWTIKWEWRYKNIDTEVLKLMG